jgi:hypothetical protein
VTVLFSATSVIVDVTAGSSSVLAMEGTLKVGVHSTANRTGPADRRADAHSGRLGHLPGRDAREYR